MNHRSEFMHSDGVLRQWEQMAEWCDAVGSTPAVPHSTRGLFWLLQDSVSHLWLLAGSLLPLHSTLDRQKHFFLLLLVHRHGVANSIKATVKVTVLMSILWHGWKPSALLNNDTMNLFASTKTVEVRYLWLNWTHSLTNVPAWTEGSCCMCEDMLMRTRFDWATHVSDSSWQRCTRLHPPASLKPCPIIEW